MHLAYVLLAQFQKDQDRMLCYCFCGHMNNELGDSLPLYEDLPAYDVLLPICQVHDSNCGCGENGCVLELECWVV